MIRLKQNCKRLPFGGHHFTDHGTVFRGESFSEVEDKLREYRINNNIPEGSPSIEILRMYAEHYPWMVESVDGSDSPVNENKDYLSWRSWIHKTWRSPPKKLVTTKEASLRWKSCEACPFNKKQDWEKTDECLELERRAFLIRRGQNIPKNIGYCACHRADLSVFTFVEAPIELSAKKEDSGQPDCCWV